MPDIEAVSWAVTTKAEDVQLGKFDSVGDDASNGLHGVVIGDVAVVGAGDAGGLGGEVRPRWGLHTGLDQESKPAGLDTGGHFDGAGGQARQEVLISWGWRPDVHAFGACNNSGCSSRLEHSPYRCNELVICGACGMVMPTAHRSRSGDTHQSRSMPQYWSRVGLPVDDSAPAACGRMGGVHVSGGSSSTKGHRSLQGGARAQPTDDCRGGGL